MRIARYKYRNLAWSFRRAVPWGGVLPGGMATALFDRFCGQTIPEYALYTKLVLERSTTGKQTMWAVLRGHRNLFLALNAVKWDLETPEYDPLIAAHGQHVADLAYDACKGDGE